MVQRQVLFLKVQVEVPQVQLIDFVGVPAVMLRQFVRAEAGGSATGHFPARVEDAPVVLQRQVPLLRQFLWIGVTKSLSLFVDPVDEEISALALVTRASALARWF